MSHTGSNNEKVDGEPEIVLELRNGAGHDGLGRAKALRGAGKAQRFRHTHEMSQRLEIQCRHRLSTFSGTMINAKLLLILLIAFFPGVSW